MTGPFRTLERSIARRYGRKRGLCRHALFAALYRSGAWRRFTAVDWARVRRLVFVCQGNICRSPYAEARARALGLHATSFGLLAEAGRPAEALAVAVARRRGIDLAVHRARSLAQVALSASDLVVGMEPWHAARVAELGGLPGLQVTLLGLWCAPPRPHLEDPFGLDEAYFETCYALADAALGRLDALAPQEEPLRHG